MSSTLDIATLLGLLPRSTDVELAADVAALAHDDRFLTRLAADPLSRAKATPEQLTTAWPELDELYRIVIRARYIEGKRATQREVAQMITELAPSIRRLQVPQVAQICQRGIAELRELIWPTHGFRGINGHILVPLKRAAAEAGLRPYPQYLPSFINVLFDTPNFSTKLYGRLLEWLRANDHADIADQTEANLDAVSRQALPPE